MAVPSLDPRADDTLAAVARLARASLGCRAAAVFVLGDDSLAPVGISGGDPADFTDETGTFADDVLDASDDVIEDRERGFVGAVVTDATGEVAGALVLVGVDAPLGDSERESLEDLTALITRQLADDLASDPVGERLRAAAEASGIGTALIDGDGLLVFVNTAFATKLGRSRDAIIGHSLDEFVAPEHPQAAAEQIDSMRAAAVTKAAYEAVVVPRATPALLGRQRSEEGRRWVRVYRALLQTGTRTDAELVQLVDITASRELEADLSRAEAASRASLDALDQGVILTDPLGNIARINPAAQRILGYSGEEISELWRTGDYKVYDEFGIELPFERRPVLRAISSREAIHGLLLGWRRKNGEHILLRMSCVPAVDEHDALVIAFTDVTDEHRAQRLLDTTLETAPVGLAVMNVDRTILRCNSMFAQMAGRPASELVGIDISSLLEDAEDRAEAVRRHEGIRSSHALPDDRQRHERRVVRPDGTEMWVTTDIAIIADPDQPRGVVATFDVTEQRRLNRDLARFGYLFLHANDIITVVDRDGSVLWASPSTGRVLGYPETWDAPGGVFSLIHPDDAAGAVARFQALIDNTHGSDPFTLRVRAASGEWRSLECVGVNLLDEPAVGGIVITSRDTTERERLTAQLAHNATHDDLTDLANRHLLESQLNSSLARAIRDDHRIGLCFIDLDGFKSVNDSYGHGIGDRLLAEVAMRLCRVIRGGDMAARIGGDEFVVMIDPVASREEAYLSASRIRDALIEVMPDLSDGVSTVGGIVCGASIGVALSSIDDTPSSLLNRADAALYQAKSRRTSAIEVAGDAASEPAEPAEPADESITTR